MKRDAYGTAEAVPFQSRFKQQHYRWTGEDARPSIKRASIFGEGLFCDA